MKIEIFRRRREWASAQELVIGQVKTDEKSNEITAIPELLNILALNGCIVSIDAAGCQKKIVSKIVEKKADYIIGLKGNQPTMLEEMATPCGRVANLQSSIFNLQLGDAA